MRVPQYFGLNDWAKKLVTKKEKVREFGVQVSADGKRKRFNRWRRVPVARVQDAGVIKGIGCTVAKLHRYTLPGGEVLTEYVQAVVPCGGPCYYIALKDKHGQVVQESLWTKDELTG